MSGKDRSPTLALLFGHEESLLSSRKWLLHTVGCDCHTVSTLADFKKAMVTETLSLVILCQTVSGEECTSASRFAAEHSAATPLLIMFSRHAMCLPEQDYVVLDATAGPEAFVKTTGSILARAEVMAGGRAN